MVFQNIPEENPETGDTKAQILKQFFTNELKILTSDVKFTELDRSPQIWKKDGEETKRNCSQVSSVQRKKIVLRYAKNLDKSKKFEISEQLPMELQNRNATRV